MPGQVCSLSTVRETVQFAKYKEFHKTPMYMRDSRMDAADQFFGPHCSSISRTASSTAATWILVALPLSEQASPQDREKIAPGSSWLCICQEPTHDGSLLLLPINWQEAA